MKRTAGALVVGYLICMPLHALAADVAAPVHYGMVTLSAEARREVSNDQANAVLYVEFTDKDAAALADRVNRALTDGLHLAQEFPAVHCRAGGNNTYAVYDRNNVATGWRAHAEIRLESPDFKQLSALVGKLQAHMQLSGVNFSLSPARRKQVEGALIETAIDAFKARADLVQKSLGRQRYKLVSMDVSTQAVQHGPRPFAMRAALGATPSVASPPMEAGESELLATAAGTIQVQ